MLGRLVREPVVHVLVLGALVFLAHRVLAPPDSGRTIVVTRALRQALRAEHERRTGMAPTPSEEAAALERWLDDELRYREALRLGLDRGDIIVRRRLVQKMEFLTEGLSPPREPSDAELEALRAEDPDRWAAPAHVTLEHVFASRARYGETAGAVAAGWRERLADGADPASLGDPFLRGREFVEHTEGQLAAVFGPQFASAVFALPVGTWAGPVDSSYGAHLVRVRAREARRPRDLAEVRDELRREWLAAERERLDRLARARLREGYTIRLETADAGQAEAAEGP